MIEGCSFPRVLVVGWCGSVRVAGVCLSLVVSSDCLLGANGAGPAFAGDGFGEAVAEPAEPVGVDLRPVESRGSQDLASCVCSMELWPVEHRVSVQLSGGF